MNQNSPEFKKQESIKVPSIEIEENNEKRMTEKINLLSSEQISQFIKRLSSPGFLGSIHLKKETLQKPHLLDNVIHEQLENKLSKSLKSPLNNPITRFLVLMMILFNVLWIIFIYIL